MLSASKVFYELTPTELAKLEKKRIFFTKPCLVEYFEKDYESVVPAKRIDYLVLPKPSQYPIDLNLGASNFIFKVNPQQDDRTLFSVKYAMSPKSQENNLHDVEKTKVYSRAGALSLIMRTPYINTYEKLLIWKIAATRYKGNLYLVKAPDDEPTSITDALTHHNYLNKLVFSESPNKPPKSDEACDVNKGLIGIFQSDLGKYNFLYSGEIVGIKSDVEVNEFDDLSVLNNCQFVLVKQMWNNLKTKPAKFLKFWLQSYLTAVSELYVGYKTNGGLITEPLEHIKVSNIPKNQTWKPGVCCGFLYNFIQMLEVLMQNIDSLDTVCEIRYDFHQRKFSYEIFEGETLKSFWNFEFKDLMKARHS